MKAGLNPRLYEMPFDQFGRYYIAYSIITELMAAEPNTQVTILDIGGYRGSLQKFFQNEKRVKITTLDIYENIADKDYIHGSALAIPFDDNTFDFTVSFEVFEHIKRSDREKYITEATRVTKNPFILTAPFSGREDEVGHAEIALDSLWRQVNGTAHPWLEEHIAYKTPKTNELEEILRVQKLQFQRFGNNPLPLWDLMQAFTFLRTTYTDHADDVALQRFYNLHLAELESNAQHYYRYVYLISKQKLKTKPAILSVPPVTSEQRGKATTDLVVQLFKRLQHDIMNIITTKNQEITDKDNLLAKRHRQVAQLEHELATQQEAVNELLASKSWKIARAMSKLNPKK